MLFVGAACMIFAVSAEAIEPTVPISVPRWDMSPEPWDDATCNSPRNFKKALQKEKMDCQNESSILINEIKKQLSESKKENELLKKELEENKEANIITLCTIQIMKGELNEANKTFYDGNNTEVLHKIIHLTRIKEDYENLVLFLSDLHGTDSCNGFIMLYKRIENSFDLCEILNLLPNLKFACITTRRLPVDDSDKQKLVEFLNGLPSSIRGIVWQEGLLISQEHGNKSLIPEKNTLIPYTDVLVDDRKDSFWSFDSDGGCNFRIRFNDNRECALSAVDIDVNAVENLRCAALDRYNRAEEWTLIDHNWRADLYILQNRKSIIDVHSGRYAKISGKQNVVKIHLG